MYAVRRQVTAGYGFLFCLPIFYVKNVKKNIANSVELCKIHAEGKNLVK